MKSNEFCLQIVCKNYYVYINIKNFVRNSGGFKMQNYVMYDDTKNNLYKIFQSLCLDLNGKKIETIDKVYQGRNSFSLREENNTITLSIAKDIYGVKDATDFIDINIGDEVTCESYQTIAQFYNQLLNPNIEKAKTEDINQLVLSCIK